MGSAYLEMGRLCFSKGLMKKVIAYIDGFNLYYRALKDTKYKWLDPEALVKNLMPNHEILKILK